MFASQLHEKMQVFTCEFEVWVGERIQRRTIQAPRLMLEQEFMSLMQNAVSAEAPVKIKMSRCESIYNQFDGEWVEREHSVTFANNAYTAIYTDEFQ